MAGAGGVIQGIFPRRRLARQGYIGPAAFQG